MKDNFHVLVAPLNWGLGHATRCIPVIRELIARNVRVSIASDGDALALLKQEFSGLDFIELPSYNPVYATNRFTFDKVLLQIPKFLTAIKREHRIIEAVVTEQKINVIISDNRYGCWSSKLVSILITHQINIQVPSVLQWMKPIINFFSHKVIRNFNQCWIPDFETEKNLSGSLSQSNKLELKFIGPLSRFSKVHTETALYKVLGIVSGPEPQRSQWEQILKNELKRCKVKSAILRGKPQSKNGKTIDGSIDIFDHMSTIEIEQLFARSEIIVSRSGFSTIMDLQRMGKKAIFVPTPGQTEQEYLANRFMSKRMAYSMDQSVFDLELAVKRSVEFAGFESSENIVLGQVIDKLILENAN